MCACLTLISVESCAHIFFHQNFSKRSDFMVFQFEFNNSSWQASCFCGSSSHYPVNIYHVYTLFMAFRHKRLFQRNWEPEKNFGMLEFEQISSSMLVYWLCNLKSLLNFRIDSNKTLRPRTLPTYLKERAIHSKIVSCKCLLQKGFH